MSDIPATMPSREWFEYEVVSAQGSMEGKVEAGDKIVDHWLGDSYSYLMWDFAMHEVSGSIDVKLVGPWEGEPPDVADEPDTA